MPHTIARALLLVLVAHAAAAQLLEENLRRSTSCIQSYSSDKTKYKIVHKATGAELGSSKAEVWAPPRPWKDTGTEWDLSEVVMTDSYLATHGNHGKRYRIRNSTGFCLSFYWGSLHGSTWDCSTNYGEGGIQMWELREYDGGYALYSFYGCNHDQQGDGYALGITQDTYYGLSGNDPVSQLQNQLNSQMTWKLEEICGWWNFVDCDTTKSVIVWVVICLCVVSVAGLLIYKFLIAGKPNETAQEHQEANPVPMHAVGAADQATAAAAQHHPQVETIPEKTDTEAPPVNSEQQM